MLVAITVAMATTLTGVKDSMHIIIKQKKLVSTIIDEILTTLTTTDWK